MSLGLDLDKSSTLLDGPLHSAGDRIAYTIFITNTSNPPEATDTFTTVTLTELLLGINNVTISGPGGYPGITISESGTANGTLEAGETWTLTGPALVYTLTQADLDSNGSTEPNNLNRGFIDNLAITSAFTIDETRQDASGSTATALVINPSINIDKVTNGADGQQILAGSPVTWTYTVTNTGNVTLSNITVTDDKGVLPTYVSGDTNSNGKLDLTEAWIYTATGVAAAGPYANIGSVSGFYAGSPGTSDDRSVTDTDPSSYFGADPHINIDKVTNGADGLQILAGAPVTWSYTVTNTGNIALSNVTVTDNQGVVPTYVSGDANTDGKVDLTETWLYTASGTAVIGNYNNIGSASGSALGQTVTDTDPSSYFGANPVINIDKVTNGADGLQILAGAPVTWSYTVTNTGNIALSNVTVTDNQGVVPTYVSGDANTDGKLDLTETWLYTASGTAVVGNYNNIGSASGSALGQTVTDTDPSSYFGANPVINIDKVTNGADGLQILAGAPVTWSYTVTNTGNIALSNVTVTDNQGVVPTYVSGDANTDGKLDLTETWLYTASGTAVIGNYDNIGSASGSALGKTVTDTDPSSYFGANPVINIDKVTNGADGLNIVAGSAITWSYTVTNTGNIALSNVTVTDNQGVVPTYVSGDANSDGKLDLTEAWIFTANGTAVAGDYSNIGTASGSALGKTVTDTDPSSYFGTQEVCWEGLTPGFWKQSQNWSKVTLDSSTVDFWTGNGANANWDGKAGLSFADIVNTVTFKNAFDVGASWLGQTTNLTLLGALNLGGNDAGVQALFRQGTAAILNASVATHQGNVFDYLIPDPQDVVDLMVEAYAAGTKAAAIELKNDLAYLNQLEPQNSWGPDHVCPSTAYLEGLFTTPVGQDIFA